MNEIFPNSSGEAPAEFDDFFRWVPRDLYNASTKPDDAVFFALVHVDKDMVRLQRGEVLPPNPAPAVGHYVVYWDGDGEVTAFTYGDDMAAAVADYNDATGDDYLFGEDQPLAGGEF